jgi:hypothetical protein
MGRVSWRRASDQPLLSSDSPVSQCHVRTEGRQLTLAPSACLASGYRRHRFVERQLTISRLQTDHRILRRSTDAIAVATLRSYPVDGWSTVKESSDDEGKLGRPEHG